MSNNVLKIIIRSHSHYLQINRYTFIKVIERALKVGSENLCGLSFRRRWNLVG